MEIALHGLVHMYWSERYHMAYAEFYQRHSEGSYTYPPEYVRPPESIWRQHLDAYFEILRQNNLPTNIRSFVPPCFICVFSKGNDQLSYILKDYGIKYISTPFPSMLYTGDEKPVDAGIENGIITVDRTIDFHPWQGTGLKPPKKIKHSYYGMHWPNILHYDPKRNLETVDRWVDYFKLYQNDFNIYAARENGMASSQALYKRFSKVTYTDSGMIIDVSDVDKQGAKYLYPDIYINVKDGFTPVCDNNAVLFAYKHRDGFTTYQLKRLCPKASEYIINLKH